MMIERRDLVDEGLARSRRESLRLRYYPLGFRNRVKWPIERDGHALQGVVLSQRLLALAGNHNDLDRFTFLQREAVKDDDSFWPGLNLNPMNHLCFPGRRVIDALRRQEEGPRRWIDGGCSVITSRWWDRLKSPDRPFRRVAASRRIEKWAAGKMDPLFRGGGRGRLAGACVQTFFPRHWQDARME